MEFLARYVVLVVLAICLCIGYIIKHSIVLNLWINGWEFTPEILLGGLASGLASTGTHELIRHLIPRQSESGEMSVNAAEKK